MNKLSAHPPISTFLLNTMLADCKRNRNSREKEFSFIHLFIHSFIHSFHEFTLCACYVLGAVPSTRKPAQQSRQIPCLYCSENETREHLPCTYHVLGSVPRALPLCKVHRRGPRKSRGTTPPRTTGTENWKSRSKTQGCCLPGISRGPLLGEARPQGPQGPQGPGSDRSCVAPAPPPGTDGGSELWQLGDARPHTVHTRAFVL